MALVQFVSLAKAAKISGVSVTRLYRFIHAGELQARVENGALVVDIQELMKRKTSIQNSELMEPTFMTLISKIINE